jgi:hypothetical protein
LGTIRHLLARTTWHHASATASVTSTSALRHLIVATHLAATARHLLAHRRTTAAAFVVIVAEPKPSDSKTDDKTDCCGATSDGGELSSTGLESSGHGSGSRGWSCGGLRCRGLRQIFWCCVFGVFAHGLHDQPSR